MQTITLKAAPEVKKLINAILPSYKKHNVFLSEFYPTTINSYWDGGSKSTLILVNLATMKTQPLPTSTHPYYDVARNGLQGVGGTKMSHLHVYYDVHKLLTDAARHCRSLGDYEAHELLLRHAGLLFGTRLICHICGHKWSL